MREKLQQAVSEFQPITLEEMDSVKLMERVDKNYVFSASHLSEIRQGMKSDYR